MSLSPFDSFQSRFVTYLLNFPRIYANIVRYPYFKNFVYFVDVLCNSLSVSGAPFLNSVSVTPFSETTVFVGSTYSRAWCLCVSCPVPEVMYDINYTCGASVRPGVQYPCYDTEYVKVSSRNKLLGRR